MNTIPPLHVPLRFFLTAPWLGLLAGLLVAVAGDEALASRWTPDLLAVTHLLTLGFMATVMLGALFQILPVLSGELVPGGAWLPTLVHLCLLAGTLLLVAGFASQSYWLFNLALPVLLLAFAAFLLALARLLLRRVAGGDALFCIRLAAACLLLTLLLGLWRGAAFAGLPVPAANLGELHPSWGLGGWVLLLVMGVSYQVIPMFHVTPSFPTPLARTLPLLVLAALLLASLAPGAIGQALALHLLSLVALVYGAYALWLLSQRKRRLPDITARFWRLSLGSLIAAALCLPLLYWGAAEALPGELPRRLPVLLGVLLLPGFAVSVIMGMLQKIVPFLSYLHLQRRCIGDVDQLKTLPHMGTIIPPRLTRWQFRLHGLALAALLLAVATGKGSAGAGLALALDFAFLGYTLGRAALLYRTTLRGLA